MLKTERIELFGEELLLHPHRAAYWVRKRTLLLSDLHLGKAVHFRRAGIPVPAAVGNENWDKLIGLMLDFEPKRVLFLGDLFHSDLNSVWTDFEEFLARFPEVEFGLVIGNHDILDQEHYGRAGLKVYPTLLERPFLFTHKPLSEIPGEQYNLCGHIHPGVRLSGGGGTLRLPCFFFGEHQGILPAFGAFTGLYRMRPQPTDRVFVLTDTTVINVN